MWKDDTLKDSRQRASESEVKGPDTESVGPTSKKLVVERVLGTASGYLSSSPRTNGTRNGVDDTYSSLVAPRRKVGPVGGGV